MNSSEVSLAPAQLCSFFSYLRVGMNWEGVVRMMTAGTKRLEQKSPTRPLISTSTSIHRPEGPRNKNSKEQENRSHFTVPCQPHPASPPVREAERGAPLCWKDNETKQKHRQDHCPGPRVIFDFFKMIELVVQSPFPRPRASLLHHHFPKHVSQKTWFQRCLEKQVSQKQGAVVQLD